jgi:hypothetical protein
MRAHTQCVEQVWATLMGVTKKCHVQLEEGHFFFYKKKTLDHLYSTHRDVHKALSRPLFGKSDHNYVLLIPVYKQKLKQEVPMTRSIQKWSDDADATLQAYSASTDWNMFRYSSNGIEENTTSVTSFINAFMHSPAVRVHTVEDGSLHTP